MNADESKATILVTGGLGFVGSHFVWTAARAGRKLIVLDDGSAGTRPSLPDEVALTMGDVGDTATVASVCERYSPTAIVHFAGKIQVGESVTNPHLYFDVNLGRAMTLLEVARGHGVDRIVFSSSAAVYGEPQIVPIPESSPTRPVNPYGASKLAFEFVLDGYGHGYGTRWAALRYFNAAGADPEGRLREDHAPETHLIPLAIDAALGRRPALTVFGDDYPTRDGTCVRDYIHVLDLADAHLRVLDRLASGENVGPLNLGTGSGATVREVIDVVGQVVGKPVPHTMGPRRAGDPSALVADPSRAFELLGWRPARSALGTIVEDALRSRR
jgi:UDP-glucose-4-epimerase GalE